MKLCLNQSFLPFLKAQLPKIVRSRRLLSLAEFAWSQVKINHMSWSSLTFLPSLQHCVAFLFDLPAQDTVCLVCVCVCACVIILCLCVVLNSCGFFFISVLVKFNICIFSTVKLWQCLREYSFLFLNVLSAVLHVRHLSALITWVFCVLFRAQAGVCSAWTARCRPASQPLWCPCAKRCPWR